MLRTPSMVDGPQSDPTVVKVGAAGAGVTSAVPFMVRRIQRDATTELGEVTACAGYYDQALAPAISQPAQLRELVPSAVQRGNIGLGTVVTYSPSLSAGVTHSGSATMNSN